MAITEFCPDFYNHQQQPSQIKIMLSEEYSGEYSEIVDVSKPPVWSPEGHEEFSEAFRKDIRATLLAMRKGKMLPICVLGSLGFLGEDSPDDMVGVAIATATALSQEDDLGQQYVLYAVNPQGKIFYPDPEAIPFTSLDGSMPPETTSPEAHRNYVKALNIHDYVFLYPEVFCPEARRRSFQKANARAFLRQAAMLYQAELEQDQEDIEVEHDEEHEDIETEQEQDPHGELQGDPHGDHDETDSDNEPFERRVRQRIE